MLFGSLCSFISEGTRSLCAFIVTGAWGNSLASGELGGMTTSTQTMRLHKSMLRRLKLAHGLKGDNELTKRIKVRRWGLAEPQVRSNWIRTICHTEKRALTNKVKLEDLFCAPLTEMYYVFLLQIISLTTLFFLLKRRPSPLELKSQRKTSGARFFLGPEKIVSLYGLGQIDWRGPCRVFLQVTSFVGLTAWYDPNAGARVSDIMYVVTDRRSTGGDAIEVSGSEQESSSQFSIGRAHCDPSGKGSCIPNLQFVHCIWWPLRI